MTIVYVHPAEAVIEQLIDDYLLGRIPFAGSDSERAADAPLVSRFDEGDGAEETASGRYPPKMTDVL